MITAIIVDDEWYNLEEVSDLLMQTGVFVLPHKYQNPIKALEEANQIRPDVAFVDIEMPVMDGIYLAQRLQEINPDTIIVFVTSWNQYAVQAFDVNALDYILKPINVNRFYKMVEKVKSEVSIIKERRGKTLKISCFGKLIVLIDNVPVKWERAKSEELFAFLLMHHNEYVSKEVIIDNLWPEYNPQKALQILQTVICNIRAVFSGLDRKVMIRYNQSKYCLSISDTKCDLFELTEFLYAGQMEGEVIKNYQKLEYMSELCKKGFLTEEAYLWSLGKDEELKKELVNILNTLIKRDTTCQGKAKFKYLCLLAQMLPYEDTVNYQLIQILKSNGRESEAKKHYEWLRKILKEQYDSEPSKRITALFGMQIF